jgi:small subunit ribosomal protein S6
MNTSRQYELVYILDPDTTDEAGSELATMVQDIVSRFGGALENTENWGRRKLAYEIGRFKDGQYVLHVINGSGEMVKELDRRLRVTDAVIRHLVVRVDEALRIATRTTDRRLSRSRRRRVARGLPPDAQPSSSGPRDDDDKRSRSDKDEED